jgi:outer membrane protein assembly factor BamB
LVDGFIYGSNWTSNGDGDWCCIDWKTGKVSYQVDWKSKGSIIAADGMLYLYDEKSGNVALVKPNPSTFDLVSSFKVSEGSGPYWSHPVIHNGYLFIRHGKALMVYNIRNVQ